MRVNVRARAAAADDGEPGTSGGTIGFSSLSLGFIRLYCFIHLLFLIKHLIATAIYCMDAYQVMLMCFNVLIKNSCVLASILVLYQVDVSFSSIKNRDMSYNQCYLTCSFQRTALQ